MSRSRRRTLIAVALALVSGMVLLAAASFGLLTTWQAQSTDFLFKTKAAESSSRVGIVAIDERSLREMGGDGRVFNWPRSHYAKVMSALSEAGARVIIVDVLFDTPTGEDDALAKAISSGTVVLPIVGELPSSAPSGAPMAYDLAVSPAPVLARAATGLGHANVNPDGDGTVRRQQLVVSSQGQDIPSLALVAAARYLRRPSVLEGPPANGSLPFAGRAIPISDGRRGMLINFLGAPYEAGRRSAFPVVSFVDVLRDAADLKPLKDRVVLIGVAALGYADDYWTPASIGRKMSGVEVTANAVETILRPAFLRPVGSAANAVLIIVLSLLSGVAAVHFRIVRAAIAAVVLVILYFLGSFTLFDGGIVANLVYPPLAPLLAFGVIVIYRVLFVEADQRAARRLLAGYLSPAVMAEVLKDPDRLHLGGEKRQMTILFSDIRGFTTYSEQMESGALASLLNEYLTEMSAVVFEQEGVVDKYIGDGLMAFWGAPMSQEDHARRACLAALGMMRRLRELHRRWQERGIPAFNIGIGINSGIVSVGNMGSKERFSYTVIGDAVNLASRIEGLTKLYGTGIIASEATLKLAGEDVDRRFLDLVAVKGKHEPVAVYELAQPADGDEAGVRTDRRELRRLYDEGLQLSAERRWQEAIATFQRIQKDWPDDGPSAFHLQRCRELAENPPPAEWDGVYVAKSK
ncbi:MAG: adenylate/guanylate cyclase domain-containing protein [Chloroflexi bacterium]|nr:adenylate/guanylate cyclase domain-containing protein [Chloroflexota bacterium]